MKRAYRRYKKHVKFVYRIKNWVNYGTHWYEPNKDGWRRSSKRITVQEMRESVYKGETFTFLRTTGNPCNCSMCQYYKYEREQNQNIQKEIWRELNENN